MAISENAFSNMATGLMFEDSVNVYIPKNIMWIRPMAFESQYDIPIENFHFEDENATWVAYDDDIHVRTYTLPQDKGQFIADMTNNTFEFIKA